MIISLIFLHQLIPGSEHHPPCIDGAVQVLRIFHFPATNLPQRGCLISMGTE